MAQLKEDKPLTIYQNNKSGYRGVYKRGLKWAAQIRVNGKAINLGIYATAKEASVAYNAKSRELGIIGKKSPNATHGMSKTKIYNVWRTISLRCTKPSQHNYHIYGGRGIKVCDRWLKFENFFADMGDSYKEGLSIDRIDVNGDYTPDNCRWATMTEQQNNTRRNRYITVGSITRTLAQWSRITGINRRTIAARIDLQGLTPREALGG